MVKLSEKTEKRVESASEFLGMSFVDTMKALIEMGLSVIQNKYEKEGNNKDVNKK